MSVHVLGIRHHGPGSARAVLSYLEELKPDIVLIEGPPEADALISWVGKEDMKPPLAILCYQPENPRRSVFYPFAAFSPEWQAMVFAEKNKIPVRFIDLPVSNGFALDKEPKEGEIETEREGEGGAGEVKEIIRRDPLSYLAEAAGFQDGEKWWEQMFECRSNAEPIFDAVTEAMQGLREHLPETESKREKLREAHMRKMIRQAERELYSTIAVVCGAWHVPALLSMPKQKEDNDLLKGLPKVKVECTWIPWTYNRLSYYSGYGAGINSPGWYDHLWNFPNDDGSRWMSKVAMLFREKGMDTSVAHVIEAVRLTESLAALREYSRPGLEELNEATLSVLCNGDPILLLLIHSELVVSNRMGEVASEIPKPPLQVDIEKLQKSLRLPATADFKDYTLDLRKENDLQRSIFLHRLQLLGIPWGEPSKASGKGTFKEQWRLQWDPSFSIEIIEKGSWGNTVEEAANAFLIHQAAQSSSIKEIAQFLENALPAELQGAVAKLIAQLNNLAAASGDVVQLMEAIPPLVKVVRYGNVRKTDSELVLSIVRSMIIRVCIGLPSAVVGLNEESSQELLNFTEGINDSISILDEEEIGKQWVSVLEIISSSQNASPVLSGYATRLLSDTKVLEGETLLRVFHFRMSGTADPDRSAAWLEGFLRGSGSILLVDQDLWTLVNEWVKALDKETFTRTLPLLRRTFSAFTPPERKKLGEKARTGSTGSGIRLANEGNINTERAKKGIPIILELFGSLNKSAN